jgi:hypothetical protein
LSPPLTASPPEFRPYRRFVSWSVLSFIVLGSVYLLTSVGVDIYRRRHAVAPGAKVSPQVTDDEIRSCYDELHNVQRDLVKDLEHFPQLIAEVDSARAQDWAQEGTDWRSKWKALGERCRFNELPVTHLRKELEEMAAAHEDLGQTQEIYIKAFKRFGTELAPRLDRIDKRMTKISERLSRATASPPGESKP